MFLRYDPELFQNRGLQKSYVDICTIVHLMEYLAGQKQFFKTELQSAVDMYLEKSDSLLDIYYKV